MSAVAIPLLGTTGFPSVDADSAELYPFVFRVTGMSIGEDPTLVSGVPRRGHSFTLGEYKYTLDRLECRPLSDTSCDVIAYYSTDGRFRFPRPELRRDAEGFRDWDLTYRKTQIEIPGFVRGAKQQRNEAGQLVDTVWWFDDRQLLDLEIDVLNVQVGLDGVDPTTIPDLITDARSQRGMIHRFLGDDWLMRMPTIHQSADQKVQISYTWEHDPGSFAPGQPGNLAPDEFVAAPNRPSWNVWRVLPVRSVGDRPDIVLVDLFPQNSPARANPQGYRLLPGRPI